jgi:mono/diheme cytochrome c family protein
MRKPAIALVAVLAVSLSVPAFAAGPDGKEIYTAKSSPKCSMCHGAAGEGKASMKNTDLRTADVQKMTDVQLTDVIAGGKGSMPAYGKKLSPTEIQAVIAYIRTLKK